jgi:hypothetical protein
MQYSREIINLKTKEVTLELNRIKDKLSINIMRLEDLDIVIR